MHVQVKLIRAIYPGCVCEVDPKKKFAREESSLGTHGRFNYARPRNLVVAHAQLKMTGFCSSDVNRRLHTDTAESVGCLLGYDHTIG